MFRLNNTVLMSGAEFFDDRNPINPYMDAAVTIDVNAAQTDHLLIQQALKAAGVKVELVPPPPDCQDGVYTADWALVRDDTAVLACLPEARKPEEDYAFRKLSGWGKIVIRPPSDLLFSGQGDALPCGNYLFAGSRYRSHPKAQEFAAEILGYELIQLQTVPLRDRNNQPVVNQCSGLPDSHFYNIDLALAVLTPKLIAWCPEAFIPASQARIQSLDDIAKIEVSYEEAVGHFACNLISTGFTVVMSDQAPRLRANIENQGLSVITRPIIELTKGGGSIRRTALTLS